jgi:signal transduction histidine kinase
MRSAFLVVITAVLYFLAARLGFYLAFTHTVIVPAWAPAGVAVALIVRYQRWPVGAGIFLGSLLISFVSTWNTPDLSNMVRIPLFLIVAAGRTLEAVVGWRLIRAWIPNEIYSSQRSVFRFFFISMVISCIGAGIMIMGFIAFNVAMPSDPLRLFFNYSLGNLVGTLLFAPLFLLITGGIFKFPDRPAMKDFAVFIALVFLVILLLQIKTVSYPLMNALPFMVVPYLLWLASRYNTGIAFVGVFVTVMVALYNTVVIKQGPFIIPGSGDYSMLYLQVFIAVISFSTLLLGAATHERKLAQHKLREMNENLEHMVVERTAELTKRNAELDSFVYRVSHDLRAPIASILGLISVAEQDTSNVNQYLEYIRRSALKQDEFIREILDHAKNSRSEPKPEEVYFENLIEQVWNNIQPSDVPVEKKFFIKQEEAFISDNWRLQVIFNNLLSNAIRYRRDGCVNIKVSGIVKQNRATITVEDQGQGISQAHLDKVFNMFYRASATSSGSGLGLYIVKETVQRLGGEVRIESQVDAGTKVTLTIPALH